MLLPRPAWPLDDGGRVGLWQGLRDVAGAFETRAIVLRRPAEAGPGSAVPPEVRALGIQVTFIEHQPPAAPVALARGVLGRWPYMLERFRSPAFERALRDLVSTWQPELAFIHHLHMATYADVLEGCTRVLRQHNLEQLWLARFARGTRNPAVAAYATLQLGRMRRAEAELCGRMDLVLAVHEEEAAAMRAFAPGVRVEVIPASARFLALAPRANAGAPTLLVVGSFDREANAEGARRFLEHGWPLVRARVPSARLRLVGRHLPAGLAARARELGAEPVGFVDDLAREFAGARAMVIPLWQGAGIRVKMIEAVAAGVPVVSTPLGAEGLGLVPGREFLDGEQPERLGEAAIELLERPERASALAAAAYAALKPRYEVETVARKTVALCEEALAARAARSA